MLIRLSLALALASTVLLDISPANAFVCAAGFYRAGCVGYRGAVVVGHPYYHPYAHPYYPYRPYYHPYYHPYRRYW